MVGANIKKLRELEGLNQKDLADRAKISYGTLSHIENGSRGVSLENLYKLAKALDMSILNFFLDEEEVNRFKYNDVIKAHFPSSDRFSQIITELVEKEAAWSSTRRVAVIDIDDLKRGKHND